MDHKEINHLIKRMEAEASVMLLDVLSTVRNSVREAATNEAIPLDGVERAHLSNAADEISKTILRLSQRQIQLGYQIDPEKAKQLAKEEGLEAALDEAVSIPTLIQEDRKKVS